MIEEAESRKAPLERFLDKFSRWYTLSLCASDLHTCGDHFGFGGGGASWGFN
ncbi:zinc/cadmium/mercury/lead-transporting ATPase [Vibrio cholerae]|nr:zinc/cadmium/mercury/lead-transporting ATPase [Vibrio cholerae]